MRLSSQREFILTIFYYITPVFILLDYLLGFNIRVSGLQQFGNYKLAYYLFCLICAFIIYRYDGYAFIVGFIESIVNLLVLFISFLLPYFTLLDFLSHGDAEQIIYYDAKMTINFMISGFILIFTFQNSVNRIAGRFGL
ncbi:MAG: hypothetical protein GWO07_16055 [Candidatus Dadabacteria bacterium]|nr:hypothetical protein [Candidatus Dadabacteria bacterium]NIS10217.1 hypothetical protein [Candidatus Dadabacteria bacterium]NIV42662.1 hypothetical protein [Candidatus Dadabacteria bacterium]NIX16585.1 hypothetical protein [Candidatus Dadabacteria bacterium]NIY23132.1 hypothetical protein [Candidatus Dadabacteria bacterium]